MKMTSSTSITSTKGVTLISAIMPPGSLGPMSAMSLSCAEVTLHNVQEVDAEVREFFGDIVFDSQILQQILASNDDIAIAIDLDWEKSYDDRPDNPKSLADKVLINQEKILQISANITSLDMKTQQIGEFLGVIKLSGKG